MSNKEIENIPKQRPLTLYAILSCGIIVTIIGIYMKFALDPKQVNTYFDGEAFRSTTPAPLVFILAGLIICVFPVYHLIKGNHKNK